MSDLEHIGVSIFTEGERLAAEAQRDRDESRRLRRELQVEVGRWRRLNAALEARLERAERLQRAGGRAASA
jgi:hypothetical protein